MTGTSSIVMNKLSIRDLELKGRRVFIRVDFNVPMSAGKVEDDTRIRETLPTLRLAIARDKSNTPRQRRAAYFMIILSQWSSLSTVWKAT